MDVVVQDRNSTSNPAGLMWPGDATFEARLREFLCDPIDHTDRFHPIWMPVRRLIGVLGNREAEKAAVVAQFCVRHMLNYEVVPVRYGFTTAAITQIKEALSGENRDALAVLILDHADTLALEPDDVDTQRFALQLEALAVEHAIFVVGCFDRVLKHAQDTYVRHFWRPWAASVVYLSPPGSAWIAAWLQTQLEGYTIRVTNREAVRLSTTEGGPNRRTNRFAVCITPGEYTVLAQHCVGASYGHLKDWVQRILYWAWQNTSVPITKDLLCGVPFMYGGNRGLHIVPVDVRRDESNFSEAVGQGPTVTEHPLQGDVPDPTLMETLGNDPDDDNDDNTKVKRIKLDNLPESPPAFTPKEKEELVLIGPGSPCVCGLYREPHPPAHSD